MTRDTALAIRNIALTVAAAIIAGYGAAAISIKGVELAERLGVVVIPVSSVGCIAVALLTALAAHLIARRAA